MKINTVKDSLESIKDNETAIKAVISLLGPDKINEPIPEEQDKTLLIWAATKGYTKIVAALINAKCDLNKHNKNYDTALILASYYGNETIAEMLINAKCDLNKKDDRCRTALMWAVVKDFPHIATMLINANCDVTLCDDQGSMIYHISKNVSEPQKGILLKLIEEKLKPVTIPTAPITPPMVIPTTPMVSYTKEQQYAILKFLIENDVKFNIIDGKITVQ